MANYAPRSLRAASVDKELRFNLAGFHTSLADILGEAVASPGVPGGCEPTFELGPRRALSSYLLGELLSKFDDGISNPEKERTTWERFHEAERLCFETNQRLSVSGFTGPYASAISRARNLADKILGRFEWDRAAEFMGWGPGASTRLPRRESDAAYKYTGNPDSTIGNAILANAAICHDPFWKQELTYLSEGGVGYVNIVPGNRIVTVPKNYKTDRTIAIEPCMNMYIQKGIGGLMRERLRLAGCNLNDQTRNQRLACIGSFSGRLATIDLSMASDLISRVFVQRFIRPDWLDALEQSRSPFGVLPSGEKIFYQKFSSMGNGYTFELESLIFYSLALAWCLEHGEEVNRVAVYGDDIILPSSVAESFCGLLRFCGFKTNEKKSYWSGPFRESCGKHYYLGHDISPFYVKEPVRRLSDLFLLHNNLQRWLWRSESLLAPTEVDAVRGLLRQLRSKAPSTWRTPRIPNGYGDGAFVGELHELPLAADPRGRELWVVWVLVRSSRPKYIDNPGLLVKGMRNLSRRPRNAFVGLVPDAAEPVEVYPVKETGARIKKMYVPQYALGN